MTEEGQTEMDFSLEDLSEEEEEGGGDGAGG